MAITPRNGYTYGLSDGRDVELVEITPNEFLLAAKDAGAEVAGAVRGPKVMRAALRFSVRKVGEEAANFSVLDAAGMKRLIPRTRDVIALEAVCAQIHTPSEDVAAGVIASMSCTSGEDAETWTAVLPVDGVGPDGKALPGRVVVFSEVAPSTVEDALREAALSAKSEAAQGFQSIISGCSRSIVSVDGVPVGRDALKGKGWDSFFSVKETYLLGAVYDEIHGTGGTQLGEVKPVSR